MSGIYGSTSPADDFVVDSFGVRGPTGPVPLAQIAPWTAGTAYVVGPPSSFVAYGGASYACTADHTSTTFAQDLAAGLWVVVVQAYTPAALATAAAVALTSFLSALPTTPPTASGVLWNDGGALSISP